MRSEGPFLSFRGGGTIPGERWEKPVALDGLDLALAAGGRLLLQLRAVLVAAGEGMGEVGV